MPTKNNNSDGDKNGMNVANIVSSPNKSSAASKRKARRRTRLMEMSKKLTTKDLTKMKKSGACHCHCHYRYHHQKHHQIKIV